MSDRSRLVPSRLTSSRRANRRALAPFLGSLLLPFLLLSLALSAGGCVAHLPEAPDGGGIDDGNGGGHVNQGQGGAKTGGGGNNGGGKGGTTVTAGQGGSGPGGTTMTGSTGGRGGT